MATSTGNARGSVRAIVATEAGRDWWRRNGESFAAHFDLTDGSPHLARLAAYRAERAARPERSAPRA